MYFGQLPEEIIIANTSISYCDEDWTCVIWNGNRDLLTNTHLLIHESWHRIQDEIGLPACGSFNQHLDETEGELLLKLELGILKDLLQNDSKDLTEGLRDAMTVRKYRQTLFPNGNENQFECHEGMAEYTAFKNIRVARVLLGCFDDMKVVKPDVFATHDKDTVKQMIENEVEKLRT